MNVLIVDDDPWVRALLTDILEFENIGVFTAASGPAALSLIETCRALDCILIDYHMPNMDGVAVIRKIQQNDHLTQARLFLMSAEWPAQRHADELAVGFVRKPFELTELLRRLRNEEAEVGPLSRKGSGDNPDSDADSRRSPFI